LHDRRFSHFVKKALAYWYSFWKMGLLQSMFLGFLVSVAASVVGNYVSKWLNRYGKGK